MVSTSGYAPASYGRQHCATHGRAFLVLRYIHFQIHYIGNDLFPERTLGSAATDLGPFNVDTKASRYLKGNHEGQMQHLPEPPVSYLLFVVSMDIPKNTPLASGLLCGDLSPMRYGRKNT